MRFTPTKRKTWRRWFAWHPVLIDDTIIWLEIIERKRDPDIFDWVYSYRLIERPRKDRLVVRLWSWLARSRARTLSLEAGSGAGETVARRRAIFRRNR